MTRKPTPVTILDAVLGTTLAPAEAPIHAIHLVNLTRLEDNPYQTRQRNDPDHVLNLAASLIAMAPTLPATAGLQQIPIGRLVRYADGHVYPADTYANPTRLAHLIDDPETIVELAFGHSRRLAFLCLANGPAFVFKELDQSRLDEWTAGRAYDAAVYRSMPVHLAHLTDQQMWEHAITENAQRLGLTPIEEAIAIERARKEFNMTYDQAGALFGKSRGAAANLVRLLQLPDDVQQMVMDGQLTERHGRELLALNADPERVRKTAASAVKHSHTVKQLAEAVSYEARQLASAQERQRQIAKAQEILAAGYVPFGHGDPLPADRFDPELNYWNQTMISAEDAGRCSADCPCLRVFYRPYPSAGDVALSPDTPGIILGCINSERHRKLAESVPPTAAAQEAQAVAVADRQRQLNDEQAAAEAKAAEIQTEADAVWAEVLERCDYTTLWNSVDFWRLTAKAVERSYYWWDKQLKDPAVVTVHDLTERILNLYKDNHKEYVPAAQRTTYNLDKLRKTARHLLKIGTAQPSTPSTPSTSTWTDDDETSHQCLMAEWDGRNWATLAKLAYTCATDPAAPCTITPAVARRLAADCPNPDDKASLLMTAARLDRDGPP